jgi:hypothetical protein
MSRRRGDPIFDPFPVVDERRAAGWLGPAAALVTALLLGLLVIGVVDDVRAVPAGLFDRTVGYFDRWAQEHDDAAEPASVAVAAGMRGYAPAAAGRDVAVPVAVEIPSVGIRSGLERLGLDGDGAIQTPRAWESAGWYRGGTRPGQQGAAVILGHVDSTTGPAVFARLRDLQPGARVRVRRADGSVAVFSVDRLEQHRKTRFPTADVYFPTPEPTLRLVTCGGDFDRQRGSYQDNLVVFASLVTERG